MKTGSHYSSRYKHYSRYYSVIVMQNVLYSFTLQSTNFIFVSFQSLDCERLKRTSLEND